jgi:hypothetical protein
MIIQGNFQDFYGSTMLPAIKAVIADRYNRFPVQWTKLLNVGNMDGSIYQTTGFTGVGGFKSIAEGQNIQTDQPVPTPSKTYKYGTFGLAVPISKNTIQDDKHSLVKKWISSLATSARETQELQAASIFNNAFVSTDSSGNATTLPDGQPLCSASHPLFKLGGVQSNLLPAADFTQGALEMALTQAELIKSHEGFLQNVPVKRVVFHPTYQYQVNEILKSPTRSDTANRAINALQYGEQGVPTPFSYRYLSNPFTWFLLAAPEDLSLQWLWRRKVSRDNFYDQWTESMVEMMRYAAAYGAHDHYGVLGCPNNS